jgi:hypothetical protein
VDLDRLDELPADLVVGVQRRQRVLEDHRDVVAADVAQLGFGGVDQVAPLEQDLAADPRVRVAREPHHRQARHALARARLADDAERLAAVHAIGDAVDRLDHAVGGVEVDLQVADLEERLRHT